MKTLLFYCQHILGMGHLVRSMEIVRGLVQEFKVYFVNGGEIVDGFQVPLGIEVINLPAIKTDSAFKILQAVDPAYTLDEVKVIRQQILVDLCDRIQPDVVMIELFPFGRGKFSFELIPLIEIAKSLETPAKIVCSLRDIVVTKRDQQKYEEKVCRLMNQYFDLLLVHGDPDFIPLAETFTQIDALSCPVYYTGYVAQPQPDEILTPVQLGLNPDKPLILTSVGGGRFGYELIDAVLQIAPQLADQLPHQIQIFAGPFMSEETFSEFEVRSQQYDNVRFDRYTPHLLSYMHHADLSISMSGYNTTLNILTTKTRAMLLPFVGNDDQEQRIRSQKLAEMGAIEALSYDDLVPETFLQKVTESLSKIPVAMQIDVDGVMNTQRRLSQLLLDCQGDNPSWQAATNKVDSVFCDSNIFA